MWFFTLALLIVAGYLLYGATKDRMAVETANELGSAKRHKMEAETSAPHHYTNTRDVQPDDSKLENVSGNTQVSSSLKERAATLPRTSMSGLSHGSIRTRDSIREIWNDAKSVRQSDKPSESQSQISERIADAVKDVKAGTKRTVDSMSKIKGGARARLQSESGLKKNAVPTLAGISAGLGIFKNELGETLHQGTVRTKEGLKKRVEGGGSLAASVVGKQTNRMTQGTKTEIRSGTEKFKDSIAQSMRDANAKRDTDRAAAVGVEGRTTVKETLITGSERFKNSFRESWASRKTTISEPNTGNEGVASKFAALKDTVTVGAVRVKDSLNETIVDAKSADLTTAQNESDSSAKDRTLSKSDRPVPISSAPKTSIEADDETVKENGIAEQKRVFLAQPQGKKDKLTKIKGIGPVIEEHLNEMGIFHFHQLANINKDDIDYINEELDFPGRIERDNWIDQAGKLAGI